jgi:hypothetical protein
MADQTTTAVAVMESTEVPATTHHQDGTTTGGTVNIVHPPDVTAPITAEVPCSPRCRCRS